VQHLMVPWDVPSTLQYIGSLSVACSTGVLLSLAALLDIGPPLPSRLLAHETILERDRTLTDFVSVSKPSLTLL
jgi:hypothetical protein